MIRTSRSQIVITEVRMPHVDGLKLLESLRQERLPKLVYTSQTNPTYVARSVSNGASDYVLKTGPVEYLINALQVCAGRTVAALPRRCSIFNKTRDRLKEGQVEHGKLQGLTNREAQVLRHLGYGLSNREVACSLEISVETVKEHVQNILRKLDCKDRTAAAVWAVREGVS